MPNSASQRRRHVWVHFTGSDLGFLLGTSCALVMKPQGCSISRDKSNSTYLLYALV